MSSCSKDTVGTEVRTQADDVSPSESGSFLGDIFFGDPLKTTRGTHRWDGCQWQALPSELDGCLQLLAQARDRNEQLASFLTNCPARHSMHGCPAYRPEPRHA